MRVRLCDWLFRVLRAHLARGLIILLHRREGVCHMLLGVEIEAVAIRHGIQITADHKWVAPGKGCGAIEIHLRLGQLDILHGRIPEEMCVGDTDRTPSLVIQAHKETDSILELVFAVFSGLERELLCFPKDGNPILLLFRLLLPDPSVVVLCELGFQKIAECVHFLQAHDVRTIPQDLLWSQNEYGNGVSCRTYMLHTTKGACTHAYRHEVAD